MSKIPDRIYIDIEDRSLYKKIAEEKLFKGKSNRELFLFAMAWGFKNEASQPLGSKDGYFFVKDLRPQDEALINAVALISSGKQLEILTNKEETFGIAERYSHAGIKLLVDKIDAVAHGSFEKHFEKELFHIYNGLKGDLKPDDQ